jgi:hypothetical protein
VELVEVAAVGELVASPDAFDAFDEFAASSGGASVLGLRGCGEGGDANR